MLRTTAIAVATLTMIAVAPSAMAQQFPTRDLAGSIPWGAGGGTDVVSRAITPLVEPILGKSIVLTNRPGGSGVIGTAFVTARPADGYNLLYAAENASLYKVLALADFDYSIFTAVNILSRGVVVITVRADSPYKSLKDLVNDALARPGKVKMASAGVGSLPYMVASLLKMATKMEVNQVPFDGDGPGVTALLGGHVDFQAGAIGGSAEHIKAGRVRPLAIVNAEPIEALPGVPPITADFPEFKRYLPWGPFYGVFVKKETPEAVKRILIDAFKKAATDPRFTDIVRNAGNVPMNIAGDEADAFIKRNQSVSAWALQEAGATKESPEKFGIPKP